MLYVSGRFLFYPLQFHDKKQRGCVKMYVNMHFDALSLFNEKGPVLSQARAFVVT